MKFKVLAFALLGSAILFAQQDNVGKVDFSFGVGFMGISSQDFSMEEYRSLAPNSAILGQDLSYLNTINSSYFNTSPLILINYGFRLKQNDRTETRLRVGVNYSNYNGNNTAYYFEDRNPYDTLRSTQTGQETYIDSVYSESLFIDFHGERLGLDISY
jgi:hypothetical protein